MSGGRGNDQQAAEARNTALLAVSHTFWLKAGLPASVLFSNEILKTFYWSSGYAEHRYRLRSWSSIDHLHYKFPQSTNKQTKIRPQNIERIRKGEEGKKQPREEKTGNCKNNNDKDNDAGVDDDNDCSEDDDDVMMMMIKRRNAPVPPLWRSFWCKISFTLVLWVAWRCSSRDCFPRIGGAHAISYICFELDRPGRWGKEEGGRFLLLLLLLCFYIFIFLFLDSGCLSGAARLGYCQCREEWEENDWGGGGGGGLWARLAVTRLWWGPCFQ